MCLHPINLIFFFRSSVQDYHKLFLSSVVLGTKELNIGYNNAMPCYFNRKGNLLSANENYECHYWLQTCSFSDWSYLYIILHLAPALTCLSSSISSIPLPQLCDKWLIYEVPLHSFLSCNMLQVILLCLHWVVFVN